MTKVTIDRELLERCLPFLSDTPDLVQNGAEALGGELRAILAAPRQPEGEGLEVVAWISCDGLDDLKRGGSIARYVVPNYSGGAEIALCRLSDHQRAIAELQAERDTLRQQLAERDAQIASMRAEVTPFIETHWMPVARQRDKLADLLDEVKSDLSAAMNWGDLDRIAVRIDAALAEVK